MENGFQEGSVNSYEKPQDTGVPKDEKWYKDYALYVASKYNPLIPLFSKTPVVRNEIQARWADRVMETEAYVKVEQYDRLFGFLGTDESNNALPTKFIKDPTPFTIFKHVLGTIRKNCMDLPKTVFANAIENEALSDKDLSVNMAKMKVDHAKEFAQLQDAGVEFKPMGNKEFESEQEIQDYATTMQDSLATFFTACIKDFLYSQHWEEKCSKMAEYVIPAYFGRVELIPNEKDIEWVVHRPAQCIWDNTYDDELGRREAIQGLVDNLTIPELLSIKEYKWEAKEIERLKNLATATPDLTQEIIGLNGIPGSMNLVWWGMRNQMPSVGRVKAFFLSWDDENECETWYRCDIIGNVFVKNRKKCDNITYNKDGSMNPPLLDFIPEMTYGCNSSIIYKMREISGKVSGYNSRITALVARAKGKVPFVYGNKVPAGMTQQSLLKQVASGLVFMKGAEIDDVLNNQDNKKNGLMEVMDLTAAIQDIQALRGEVNYWENKMREMASTPLIQMGAQTDIIGKGVQAQTIEQSTLGMLPLYHGFILWVNNILNVAAQMKKNIITSSSQKEYALQVSPNQYEYFKITKDMSLVDLQIYLSQQDRLDEEDKAYIGRLAERDSSIPGTFFNTLDALELLKFSTKTEMLNYLRYAKQKFDAQQAKAAEQQAMQAQEDQAANLQNQQNITDTQVQGTLDNTELKNEAKNKEIILEAALNEESKEQA